MQIIEVKNKKLVADEGKIIRSKATHEEDGKIVYNVESKIVYLGKNDSIDNYEEVQATVESEEE